MMDERVIRALELVGGALSDVAVHYPGSFHDSATLIITIETTMKDASGFVYTTTPLVNRTSGQIRLAIAEAQR